MACVDRLARYVVRMSKHIVLHLPAVLLACCLAAVGSACRQHAAPRHAVIEEVYVSTLDSKANIDSLAVWHGDTGRHWILATAKSTHEIIVYDAATGVETRRFGRYGAEPGSLNRPNGIAVVDNLAIIIERDNRRIQIFELPSFRSVVTFGQNQLMRPYGITVAQREDAYAVYVTDNDTRRIRRKPSRRTLASRLHRFDVSRRPDTTFDVQYRGSFGETGGDGALYTVESILVDLDFDRLLIADEHERRRNIKIYSLDGSFTGQIIPNEYFVQEPEGIVLAAATGAAHAGYYIATDQCRQRNIFHLFDRETLAHITGFSGAKVRNTDGIALTRQPFGRFEHGALFAVHNDRAVAAFCLGDIDRLVAEGKSAP